jgi:hypothetical protein
VLRQVNLENAIKQAKTKDNILIELDLNAKTKQTIALKAVAVWPKENSCSNAAPLRELNIVHVHLSGIPWVALYQRKKHASVFELPIPTIKKQ